TLRQQCARAELTRGGAVEPQGARGGDARGAVVAIVRRLRRWRLPADAERRSSRQERATRDRRAATPRRPGRGASLRRSRADPPLLELPAQHRQRPLEAHLRRRLAERERGRDLAE